MAKVSIITPLFNRLNLISETWESIKNQTYSNWEWIVVDDGSTDGGDEYVKKLMIKESRIKFLKRKDGNKGPSRCRNIGVSEASGEYLIFLDSDDLLASVCLEQRVKEMHNNAALDFGVFKLQLFNGDINNKGKIFNKYFENQIDYLHNFLMDEPPWQTTCPVWRTESFTQLGGFNEDFWIMDDPELHVRAIINELKFEVFLNYKPDCFYRINYNSDFNYKQFHADSALGRMKFIKEINLLIPKNEQSKTTIIFKNGIKRIISNWLFKFSETDHISVIQFIDWCKKNQLLNKAEYYLAAFNSRMWQRNLTIVKLLKIKGLISLLFKKL